MAVFIGSDEQIFENDFGTKIANSTLENNMKIYHAGVNPSNIPAPASPAWREITKQAFLDKLKNQDGTTAIEMQEDSTYGNVIHHNAPMDGMLNVEIGGNTLYKRADGTYTSTWEEGCALESVGESEGNKIEVLSKGKNLFDGTWENKFINSTTGEISDNFEFGLSKLIPVKSNQNYVCSINADEITLICFSDNSNIPILSSATSKDGTQKIIIPSNAVAIRIKAKKTGGFSLNTIAQLEEGTTPTTYEPYREDKINIPLNEPLRKLPNDVQDVLGTDGVITRNVGKVVLDGSEVWTLEQNYADKLGFYLRIDNKSTGTRYTFNCISNTLPSIGAQDVISNNSIEGIAHDSDYSVIRISILKSRLSTSDLAGFKQWLQANPTTVYYELATPVQEHGEPITLQSFANGSVSVDSNIVPYVREWHTVTDTDGIMQYMSSTSGLMSSFLVETDYTNLVNALYGGSNDTFRNVVKKVDYNYYGQNIGGRNLLLISQLNSSFSSTILTFNSFTGRFWASRLFKSSWIYNLKPNQQYTISYKAKLISKPTTIQNEVWSGIGFRFYKAGLPSFSAGKIDSSQYESMNEGDVIEVVDTFITPEYIHESDLMLYTPRHDPDINAKIEFIDVKLEKGNKATDWTPAPEDLGLETITTNNKYYFMLNSDKISNKSEPSTIALDYVDTNLTLSRLPDVVDTTNIPPCNMGSNNVVLLKGFAPAYTEQTVNKNKVLFHLKKDKNNYWQLYFDATSKRFNFVKCVDGVITTLSSEPQTFMKWQVFNILCQQNYNGMYMYILKNNSNEFQKFRNDNTKCFLGDAILYPLTKDVIGNEADAFIEDICYFHDKIFTDDDAEKMLKGTVEDYMNPELIDKELKNIQKVNVIPNNRYNLITDRNVTINEMYNNILLKSTVYDNNSTFIIDKRANNIKLEIEGGFGNISLRRMD